MKKISYWAFLHVKQARLLLVFLKFAAAGLAGYTGLILYQSDIILPSQAIYFSVFLILLFVLLIYPERKKITRHRRFAYTIRVTCNFLLALVSSLTIATFVNNANLPGGQSHTYANSIIKGPTAEEILASGKTKDQLTKKEKRILKKEFYKQAKNYLLAKASGDDEKAGKALKIILAIIVMVGLLYLLAGLACNLSCSGSDAGAVIVLVLGLTGLIWAFVAIMKRISRGPKNKRTPSE